jgi:plasmid stabilization system protein ParE
LNSKFLPAADDELIEAARYYEHEAAGVGIAFITAVHQAVTELLAFPFATPSIGAGIRKKVLRHFAYTIFYSIEADTLLIIAVAHQKKRPNYWHSRCK